MDAFHIEKDEALAEKAIVGLPRFASIEEMLRQMDDAGVEKVFITQCKMWSYVREKLNAGVNVPSGDMVQYGAALGRSDPRPSTSA